MGKYDIEITGWKPEQIIAKYSEMIANELAEINRLTILKMKLNHGIITSKDELKAELVDKA